MKKANVLIAAGAALLVVGIAVIALLSRSDDGGDTTPTAGTVRVIVATSDLEAGSSVQEALDAGQLEPMSRSGDDVPAGAIRDGHDLEGATFSGAVDEGAVLVESDLDVPSLVQGAIQIPEGRQAMAVTVDFTAGGAGYVAPGDRVNVYVNIQPDARGAEIAPHTRLLLSDIEVLDVSEELGARRSVAEDDEAAVRRSGSGTITLLLALDAAEAERAVFGIEQNTLWVTIVPDGQGPSETDGVTYGEGYLPEPGSS